MSGGCRPAAASLPPARRWDHMVLETSPGNCHQRLLLLCRKCQSRDPDLKSRSSSLDHLSLQMPDRPTATLHRRPMIAMTLRSRPSRPPREIVSHLLQQAGRLSTVVTALTPLLHRRPILLWTAHPGLFKPILNLISAPWRTSRPGATSLGSAPPRQQRCRPPHRSPL